MPWRKPDAPCPTRRPPPKESRWKHGVWYLLFSLPVGLGVLSAFLCLIAGMMLLADAADWMLSCMAGVALLLAGGSMGYYAGAHKRRYGLKTGALCGLILYGILFLAGLFWRGDAGGILRPILLVLSGAWGGAAGVNRRM